MPDWHCLDAQARLNWENADIVLDCPGCGKRYEIDAGLAGKKSRCKQCGEVFKIPVPSAVRRPIGTGRPNPVAAATIWRATERSFSASPAPAAKAGHAVLSGSAEPSHACDRHQLPAVPQAVRPRPCPGGQEIQVQTMRRDLHDSCATGLEGSTARHRVTTANGGSCRELVFTPRTGRRFSRLDDENSGLQALGDRNREDLAALLALGLLSRQGNVELVPIAAPRAVDDDRRRDRAGGPERRREWRSAAGAGEPENDRSAAREPVAEPPETWRPVPLAKTAVGTGILKTSPHCLQRDSSRERHRSRNACAPGQSRTIQHFRHSGRPGIETMVIGHHSNAIVRRRNRKTWKN